MNYTKYTKSQIREFEWKAAKLKALEDGGVRDWNFYDYALRQWREDRDKEEAIEDLFDELQAILQEGAYEPSERGAGFAFDERVQESAMELLNDRILVIKAL